MDTLNMKIELAEDAYNAYGDQAETAPHRWGQAESDELARLAENLRRLYDAANTPTDERIAL